MAVYFSPEGLKYNPYSIDDLLKPLDKYREAFNSLDNKFQSLMLDPKNYKAMLNPEKDSKSYTAFEDYNNNLNAAYENFYNNGINSAINDMVSLRQQRGQLSNIERAYASKVKDFNNIVKLVNSGKIVDINPDDLSVDSYVDNPDEARYNVLDPKLIYNDAREILLPIDKSYQKTVRGKATEGLSEKAFSEVYNEKPESDEAKEIDGAIKSVLEKYKPYYDKNTANYDTMKYYAMLAYYDIVKEASKRQPPVTPASTRSSATGNNRTGVTQTQFVQGKSQSNL